MDNLLIFPELKGKCKQCGTKRYTVKELNLSPDQHMTCYKCLSINREKDI